MDFIVEFILAILRPFVKVIFEIAFEAGFFTQWFFTRLDKEEAKTQMPF